jgi:hypothetical protein
MTTAAAINVWGALCHLRGFDIWDKAAFRDAAGQPVKMAPSVQVETSKLLDDQSYRVTCVDIGSIELPEGRCLLSSILLRAIWNKAREEWLVAMKEPATEDRRRPISVVIDEAHNIAPSDDVSTYSALTNEILVQIAAEGRKFGLFLILVTQRPSRLNPSLLSQCDNLCLLKMNDLSDLALVERTFGFLPPGLARRAADFDVGDALLAGQWVGGGAYPVYAHIAPRRTMAGGRNLDDRYWTVDPVPASPEIQTERS